MLPAYDTAVTATSQAASKYFYYNPYGANSILRHNAIPGLGTRMVQQQQPQLILGDTFIPNTDIFVNKLLPQQGSIIFSGRCNQFIKFSSNNGQGQIPNIKIINGLHTNNVQNQFIKQDINKDSSSIYITAQDIQLKQSTNINNRSTSQYSNRYSGNSIITNSDMLVFNSRLKQIFMLAKKDIYIASQQNVCIDAVNKIILQANQIQLTPGATQPAILGNKLSSLLTTILDKLQSIQKKLIDYETHTHVNPAGPTGPPVVIPNIPVYQTIGMTYRNYKQKLNTMLSKIIKLK